MLDKAKADTEGKKKVHWKFPKLKEQIRTKSSCPRAALQSSPSRSAIGHCNTKRYCFNAEQHAEFDILSTAEGVTLHIGSADPSMLPEALKAKIGDRPL